MQAFDPGYEHLGSAECVKGQVFDPQGTQHSGRALHCGWNIKEFQV
jgi:hypothetical protein